jgi:flagellar hook-length control protein FliK
LKAVQTATLAPDDKPVLEPGAGPRSENANDQAFMAPRQGANKPFAQGQNPVAIAAKSIGETMKAEHAVAAPVTDIDAPVAERAISRADAVSVAADKSVSINPVRDQVLAALVSRHGEGRLEVRLDPPELGRVMIRFEGDGGELVRAVISADTPETLDLMRRNADAFHKSLAEQGFEGLDLQFTEHGAKDASDEEFEAEKTFIAANELERAAGLEEHDATGRMVALGRLDRRL